MTVNTSVLGRGIGFPFSISGSGSSKTGIDTTEGEQHVIDSIAQILGTPIGSRTMRRDFGSRLHEIPFEPLDEGTKGLIDRFVLEALGIWEPRIEVLQTNVTHISDRGRAEILITFRIIRTNVVRNFVFPFYLDARDIVGTSTK